MPDRRDEADRPGTFTPGEPPEMIFEVVTADGAEAKRLAAEQARAIREVIGWLARRQSSSGQAPAA